MVAQYRGLVMVATLHQLPASLKIGKSIVCLEQDALSTLSFINGFQAGNLTYEVYGKKARLYDTDLTLMIVARQNTRHQSAFFNTGFVTGHIATLTQKGVYVPTNQSFCEGYQEGKQAYILLSAKHVFTSSELCSLISWQQKGHNSAFNSGYVTGFIQGLTEESREGSK